MRFLRISAVSLLSLVACAATSGEGDDAHPASESSGVTRPPTASAVTPDLYRPFPPITSPSWSSVLGNSTCQQQAMCAAVAATPGYEVTDSGEGENFGFLFQANGLMSGQYYYPFVCDPVYAGSSGTCTPDGTGNPCCPTGVTSLQTDAEGNAWWIDQSTSHIHFWVRHSRVDVDLDRAMGDDMRWQSVSAGAPIASASNGSPSSQVWAITTSGSIYALMGYVIAVSDPDNPNQPTDVWLSQYPYWFPVGGAAVQIGFMNETNPTSLCGAGWHIPWVRTSAGQIFEFVPQENNCYTGSWTQLPGAANQLASADIVLGTDDQIYTWNQSSGSFLRAMQPPLAAGVTVETVGGQPGVIGVIATDSHHEMWQETCGTFGC